MHWYIFELFIDLHVHLIEFGNVPKFFSIALPRTGLKSVPHFLNSFNFPFIFYQFSYYLQQIFLLSSTNSFNMHKGSNELLAKSLKRTFFDLMISVAIHPIQMHKINSFACETMREYFVLKKLLR